MCSSDIIPLPVLHFFLVSTARCRTRTGVAYADGCSRCIMRRAMDARIISQQHTFGRWTAHFLSTLFKKWTQICILLIPTDCPKLLPFTSPHPVLLNKVRSAPPSVWTSFLQWTRSRGQYVRTVKNKVDIIRMDIPGRGIAAPLRGHICSCLPLVRCANLPLRAANARFLRPKSFVAAEPHHSVGGA